MELQSHIEEMERTITSLNQQLMSAQSKLHSLKTSLEEQIQTLEVSLISRHAMHRYMQSQRIFVKRLVNEQLYF